MKPNSPHRRLAWEWWGLLILASLFVGALVADRTAERFDNLVYDRLLQLRTDKPEADILLVTIDEKSLRQIGRWPWPRSVHAALIDRLSAARPRAIGYDILFTEPGPANDDALLGQAMARAGNVYVPLTFAASGDPGTNLVRIPPIAPVAQGAAGVGHVNLHFDRDGLVRSAVPAFEGAPHLMALVGRTARPDLTPPSQTDAALIPFTRSAGRWPEISATAVLNGSVPPELLRGKVILVGVTADGLGDRYPVPLHGVMSGVEIQANLLDGLLGGTLAHSAGIGSVLALALIPLWLLMIVLRRAPSRMGAAALALLVLVVLAVSAIGLFAFRLWLPPMAALLGLLFVYPLWNWRQLAATESFMHAELYRLRDVQWRLPLGPTAPMPGPAVADSTSERLGAAIDQARQMLRFIAERLDQLPDAIFVVDPAGRVVLQNDAAVRLLEDLALPAAMCETIGPLLARLTPSDGGPLILPAMGDANPAPREASGAGGRFFDIRFAPQTDAGNAFAGWVIRLLDISDAKAASRQREDILQLLTHDMRSPQASILAVLEVANIDQIDPEIADRIRHYAQRTLGLADGFVQLARAETLAYALEEINIGDVVLDAIDDLWPQLTAKHIAIETLGAGTAHYIRGERSLLTRAIINVIGNAVKFSAPNTQIICTLGQHRDPGGQLYATCAIADQGPGLAPEHIKNIFEPYFRAPMGVDREMDGVGLGLSFVHTVITRHSGRIEVDSAPGEGTTFTFYLPLIA
ncbi:CHASE2 domain-containing protein [Sphingomonas sp. C3-2]|uniref:CHASE2 domain-containing protein n=1 Tax=Sphingomonas sp. C3-2 TaxID=3062169 RepID=UPI00294B21FB|nr:CHASE2 domain-containing protein [Sphingomonas sp. C3-2]WOK38057.1 CHASE2 domain-containing protein [Sphingomonas sp. C3-2]